MLVFLDSHIRSVCLHNANHLKRMSVPSLIMLREVLFSLSRIDTTKEHAHTHKYDAHSHQLQFKHTDVPSTYYPQSSEALAGAFAVPYCTRSTPCGERGSACGNDLEVIVEATVVVMTVLWWLF